MMDFGLLNEMLAQKYIKRQNNADGSLAILNYTNLCQWNNEWSDVTRAARGIIYDPVSLDVVARPFPKFFNLSQHTDEEIPQESFKVYTKWDGSLAINYHDPIDNLPAIATRGSFQSTQAIHATELLRTKYSSFRPDPHYTFLFEAILPENRIVVNYDQMEDLVLLDVIEIATGKSALDDFASTWPGPLVQEHGYANSSTSIRELGEVFSRMGTGTDMEGVVLRFDPSGFRIKVKSDEYVRLHKILTNISVKDVWLTLSEGRDIAELSANTPDEFFSWILATGKELQEEFESFTVSVRREYMIHMASFPAGATRREIAEKFKEDPFASFYFLLLDGKVEAFEKASWKQLRPVGVRNTAFKTVNPDAD